MSQKVLVFGANGQLGLCLKSLAEKQGLDNFIFLGKEQGNILDNISLRELFELTTPKYVINCAAYTAVDKAEDEIELARDINVLGASNLAAVCNEFGSILIHISTDFVFQGDKTQILNETDTVNPINVYGLTKLEGENEIVEKLNAHYIIRTSWLYSEFGNNFVKTMLKLAKERSELGVIVDQIGTPTYAIDLANCILKIIEKDGNKFGMYHFSNEGVASWYDFAQEIFHLSNLPITIKPLRTDEYPTKAKRPNFSVLDKSKIKNSFGIEIPYWKDSLSNCINLLLSSK